MQSGPPERFPVLLDLSLFSTLKIEVSVFIIPILHNYRALAACTKFGPFHRFFIWLFRATFSLAFHWTKPDNLNRCMISTQTCDLLWHNYTPLLDCVWDTFLSIHKQHLINRTSETTQSCHFVSFGHRRRRALRFRYVHRVGRICFHSWFHTQSGYHRRCLHKWPVIHLN